MAHCQSPAHEHQPHDVGGYAVVVVAALHGLLEAGAPLKLPFLVCLFCHRVKGEPRVVISDCQQPKIVIAGGKLPR